MNSYEGEEYESKLRKIVWEVIEKDTGIELNVNEQIALNLYYASFKEFIKKDDSIDETYDSFYWFIIDYFKLDLIELGRIPNRIMKHGAIEWKNYGMNLLGDERFKKYCRRNVDDWREERGLI